MRLGLVVGVGVAVALGLWMYSTQMENLGNAAGAGAPAGIVDTVGVKTDLLGIGGAMKQQVALEGKYFSLEEMRARGTRSRPGGARSNLPRTSPNRHF